MKSILLILSVATNVIAFEQIFAVNCGGDAYTDSDGIIYQKRDETHAFSSIPRDYKNVLVDEIIYKRLEIAYKTRPSIKYEIPLKRDGLYLLIAKYSYSYYAENGTQDMNLNNKIQLASNLNVFNLCGGKRKICDEYYYFCVSDKTIYYKNQSSIVKNEKIHIDIRSTEGIAKIAGLVVLKESLGERQILKSSATNEPLYFDFEKIHPKCQNQLKELLNQQLVNIQMGMKSTVEANQQNSNQILTEQSRIQKQSAEQMDVKFNELRLELFTKIEAANKNQQEQQNDGKTSISIAQNCESHQQSFIQQMQHIQNQTIETLICEFECLQTELTTQTNQASKNIEMLQIIVRTLVDDNRKMQAEIKQISEKKEESAKYHSLK
jgi:Malectin domain